MVKITFTSNIWWQFIAALECLMHKGKPSSQNLWTTNWATPIKNSMKLVISLILFHDKILQTMLWHHNARVNSHQRWKQKRFRVCFHLWCELTSTNCECNGMTSFNGFVPCQSLDCFYSYVFYYPFSLCAVGDTSLVRACHWLQHQSSDVTFNINLEVLCFDSCQKVKIQYFGGQEYGYWF